MNTQDNRSQETTWDTTVQRDISGILVHEVDQQESVQSNPRHQRRERKRTMQSYYDDVHVRIHGRTAGEVRRQYGYDENSTISALKLLRIHEPHVALQVEQENQRFRDEKDTKDTKDTKDAKDTKDTTYHQ